MLRRTTWMWAALAIACGAAPSPARSTNELGTSVEMFAPGLDRVRFVSARLAADASSITGCVMPESAPCEETMRVALDDDARQELEALLGDLGERASCEAEEVEPTDRRYTLRTGDMRYEGHLPSDPTQVAARMAGPCRADARLAWWLARWLVAASRAGTERPSRLGVTVDATRASGPRFIVASIDPASDLVEGCDSATRTCAQTQRITLDEAGHARLGVLLEDVRIEPCHAPFPAGEPLAIEAGLVYDGPCGADADLAWWLATQVVPGALEP